MAINVSVDEKQYEIILSALTDKIAELETTNFVQKCKIENLEKALADAEHTLKLKEEKLS